MSRNVSQMTEHALQSVWETEDRDFTPWLMENIGILGAAIGIRIENPDMKEKADDYSADIVARNMHTGEPVVIENQYGETDHTHLGKLLTDSSHTEAGFSIWISEDIRPEHQEILEWLNGEGPDGVKFFGIKPRVVSIAGSNEHGFEFEVVVEPDGWDRDVTNENIDTEPENLYHEFYSALISAYAKRRPDWDELEPARQDNLMFRAGIPGTRMGWAFHHGESFAVELHISTPSTENNNDIYTTLKEDRATIESELGTPLTWKQLPDTKGAQIAWPKPIDGHITELSPEQRTELINWGVEAMDKFQDKFEPRVPDLHLNGI